MQLPEKGSPDRIIVLREASIDDLLKLSYEELDDMSIRELELIFDRLDKQIKKLEIQAESERKPSVITPPPKDSTSYKREPYFLPKEEKLKLQYENKLKSQRELTHKKELERWAQDSRFKDLMTRYRCAMKDVRTRLEIISMGQEMQYHRHLIESISDRIKTPESIQRKLEKKKKPVKIETILYDNPIYDIAGIRVICAFKDDIERIEELLRKQPGITILGGERRKDHITIPKDSGYRSLHLTVKVPVYLSDEPIDTCVEVQIRTLAMDFWSCLEHDIKYKKDIPNKEEVTKRLLKCAEDIAKLDEEMIQIRDLARREQ